MQEETCCPKFDKTPWDDKDMVWKDKLFLLDSIPQFMHMPLPFMYGKKITSMWDKATKLGGVSETSEFLLMAYDPSPWKSELYLAINKEIPGEKNVRLSGNYYSKVFDGPYNAVPRWIKEMEEILSKKGKKSGKYYFYYTTCPKCAKKYGHNYVVAIVELV